MIKNEIKKVVVFGGVLIFSSSVSQNTYGKNSATFFVYNSSRNEETNVQQRIDNSDMRRAGSHLYKKALNNIKENLYWKSALDLIVLLDFYPEFSKLDGVIYHLGYCLYEMEMFEGAAGLYEYLLKAIPKTPFLADALLGLQKVYYQKNNYQQSLRFYKALEAYYSDDEVINESRYYAGQSYFHLNNYILVPEIMTYIERNSEFYLFGLYTSGLAYLKKKDVREAIKSYKKIVRLPVISAQRREIIDTVRLTLGYIYFELSSYKEALKYLKVISPTFYDYPDVLLAIGWTALKSKDYETALTALNKLLNEYPDNYNVDEAHFVLGQCYLKLGYYKFAIREYYQIIKKAPGNDNLTALNDEIRSSLTVEERRIEELRTQLLVLESKLLDTIPYKTGNGIPKNIAKELEKIHKQRESLLEKILKEHEIFEIVSSNVAQLKRQIEKRDRQRDWRAYAEYGKARAMFLKGLTE